MKLALMNLQFRSSHIMIRRAYGVLKNQYKYLQQFKELQIDNVPDLPYHETVPLAWQSFKGTNTIDETKAPMVMLHGILGHKQNFSSVGRHICSISKRDVVAVDMRNHGATMLAAPHDYMSMTRDAIAFVEQNFQKPVVLAGYLMGAKVAMLATLFRPELFEKLVVIDNSPVDQPLESQFLTILVGMAYVERDESVKDLRGSSLIRRIDQILAPFEKRKIVRQYLTSSLNRKLTEEDKNLGRTYKVPILNFLKDRTLEQLELWPDEADGLQYSGPVRVMRGLKSPFVTDTNLKRDFPKYFPHVLVTDFNAGHWLMSEQPERFVHQLLAFLER